MYSEQASRERQATGHSNDSATKTGFQRLQVPCDQLAYNIVNLARIESISAADGYPVRAIAAFRVSSCGSSAFGRGCAVG